MKRYFKSIAAILFLASSWLAGMGFYHVTTQTPPPSSPQTTQRQDSHNVTYQPIPVNPVTSPAKSQPAQKPSKEAGTSTAPTAPGENTASANKPDTVPAKPTATSKQQSTPAKQDTGQVIDVHDGDTITVKLENDQIKKVRLIGMDAPELAPDEFGITAAAYARKLLQDKKIKLVYGRGRFDKYDRTLAYVYLADGTFVNALLVQKGYARVMTIPPNTAYAAEFNKLQGEAQKAHTGIWAIPTPPLTFRDRRIIWEHFYE